MSRAGQTPHGARPNREEVRGFGCGHVPARCVEPSGRSLEPRSDARPRGMVVPQEQSRGQNSAYRSGCHKLLLYEKPFPAGGEASRTVEVRREVNSPMKAAVYVYGLASAAAGIMDLIWGDFDSSHQPIQAFGDHIPGLTILADITGVWMIAGDAAILWRRSTRVGGAMLAVIYFVFTVFWLPRFY